MFRKSILAAVGAVAMLGAIAAPDQAKAAILDFTFIGATMADGGSFDITKGVAVTDSNNVVISLSGHMIGLGTDSGLFGAISLVAPGTSGFDSWNWDGKMSAAADFFTASSDSSGILFTFGDGNVGNLYLANNPDHQIFLSVNTDGTLYNPGDLGTLQVTAVPEPSTWAMMILGFVGIGAMTYRRRTSATLAA
jgi:hypothetical protein